MLFQTISSPKIVGPQTFQVSAQLNWHEQEAQSPLKTEQDTIPKSLTHTSARRKIQFLAGRHCMKEAIKAAFCGHSLADKKTTFSCPKNIISSSTQTGSFVSAAVSFQDRTQLLGIDSERIFTQEALKRLWPVVLTKREMAFYEWNYKNIMNRQEFISLLFSAKQSLMKAFSPIAGTQSGFQDFLIAPNESGRDSFTYELLKAIDRSYPKGFSAEGQFDFRYNHVHTAVEVS
ncbi:MAG: 4'-phosphopantetheinyl transferase family protein [Oligoflexus sp.]